MSVINNVLKDLENRPSAFTPLELNSIKLESTKKAVSYVLWSLALFLLLLIAVLAYVYYSQGVVNRLSSPNLTEKSLQISPQQAGESVAEVTPDNNMSPLTSTTVQTQNEIFGLQINETTDFLQLSFQFTQPAHSFLKQHTGNRYIFLIRNSSQQIITPIINNPWLTNISFSDTENDVEIQFDTVQGVLVENLHQHTEDNNFWIIRLKKSIKPESSEVISNIPVASSIVKQSGQHKADKKDNSENKVVEIQPEDADNQAKTVRLQIKTLKHKISDAERLNKALRMMKAGDRSSAEQQLQQLIGSKVDKASRINLLNLYRHQGNHSEFQQLLSQSLRLYQQDMGFKLFDANQLFLQKEYVLLIDRYQEVSSSLPLLSLLAGSYQRLNRHDNAIGYYKKALKLDPQQPKNWISLAISQEHQAQFNQALQAYRMASRSGTINQRLQTFVQQRIAKLDNRKR